MSVVHDLNTHDSEVQAPLSNPVGLNPEQEKTKSTIERFILLLYLFATLGLPYPNSSFVFRGDVGPVGFHVEVSRGH